MSPNDALLTLLAELRQRMDQLEQANATLRQQLQTAQAASNDERKESE